MRIHQVHIERFRGIKRADLCFGKHSLLVGDNSVGKTTVLEAINLALGPDRAPRQTELLFDTAM